jgi:hypothetical protein
MIHGGEDAVVFFFDALYEAMRPRPWQRSIQSLANYYNSLATFLIHGSPVSAYLRQEKIASVGSGVNFTICLY